MSQPDKINLVIFAGAGFSAAFKIPVMRQFSDRIRDQKILSVQDQAEFDNIQRTCDSMGALIGSSSRNLEQLSSFLAVQNINDPGFIYPGNSRYKTPSEAIKLIKRCIFELVLPDLTIQDVNGHAQFFDDELHKLCNVTFVTTNYDLVLEMSGLFKQKKLRPTPTVFKNDKSPTYSIYSWDQTMPPIFKLHGSINWFSNGSNLFYVHSLLANLTGTIGLATSSWLSYKDGHNFESSDCLIVPPSVIKPQVDEVLGEQWRGATEALKHADAVWFVGYSFPESDSFMRYFLASGLATNTRIRQLVVIDPDMAVKKRSLTIFRAERLKEVFAFIPLQWQLTKCVDLAQGKVELAAHNLNLERHDMRKQLRDVFYCPDDE
ncbi:MAG TPA: SIR2 family protein [Tepidisphaeraceae bacterium]|jgi:hypothetical protein|nr:SIR2 family protein [Tepidisphaeraceae bacterium]